MKIGSSFFSKIKEGLVKTSSKISCGIKSIISSRAINAQTIEDLEDMLMSVDVGVKESHVIARNVFDIVKKSSSLENIPFILRDEIAKMLSGAGRAFDFSLSPKVILFCGINGAGKTTTVGKIGRKFRNEGKSVLLAACDTFRAAAVQQLQVWSERSECDIFYEPGISDASAVAYRAARKAIDEKYDVLLIDTAGRLHNQENFMAELEKLNRTIKKADSSFPHNSIMVIDATIGQIALEQLKIFKERIGVDGIILTKLDGTAKGGVVLSAFRQFHIGIYGLGLGEQQEDFIDFDPSAFASGLVGLDNDL